MLTLVDLEEELPTGHNQHAGVEKFVKGAAKKSGFSHIAPCLAEMGHDFQRRGWALGTSGNFSALLSREPIRLAITPTGVDKGLLTAGHILEIDDSSNTVEGLGRPSSEARIHVVIVRLRSVGAVLHTHSVWSTVLSQVHASGGGLAIEGYEMLKGLSGVKTHQYLEWLPIIENSQDLVALSGSVEETLRQNPDCHGFLLRGHGLYTWGLDLNEAKRHVEILEFLFEVMGRTYLVKHSGSNSVFLETSLASTGRWEGFNYGGC